MLCHKFFNQLIAVVDGDIRSKAEGDRCLLIIGNQDIDILPTDLTSDMCSDLTPDAATVIADQEDGLFSTGRTPDY